jgi:hypothetical protein
MFDMSAASGYKVPTSFVVYGFIAAIIHIIVTILIDYVRRLNSRRGNLHEFDAVTSSQEGSGHSEVELNTESGVKPAELMEYAAKSPVSSDKSSPSPSVRSNPSPGGNSSPISVSPTI